MSYKVHLARSVPKQLNDVPKRDYGRVYKKAKGLAAVPRPDDCVKIDDNLYRIRVGAYRIIYLILDVEQIVLIVKIARRSEKTYRRST